MNLRAELLPPVLDDERLHRLAQLADWIDGASREESEAWLSEFNQLSETSHEFEDFQGLYGGGEHIDWVRLVLYSVIIQPAENVTRDELVELAHRCMPENDDDFEAYLEIFSKNVPYPDISDLIFWPTHVPGFHKEEPTADEIVDFVLNYKKTNLSKHELTKLLSKHINDTLTKEEFYLLSENLEDFELNSLSFWLQRHQIAPQQAIELILAGKIVVNHGTITLLPDELSR
ncbi:hypothetical protein [Photobacterium galatheae]|uniref:hypothetical protein n=1 Tax=Photobacterium galatheae TaxID=1654360 RepID=UPI001267955F|nr:hypothetical protein [Photobacterium galatheae]MCM0147108.1 hypothetical protein [Photobacterium galatheae]